MLLGARYSFALLYESMFSRELVGRCWDHQRHVSYRVILSPNGQAQCECTGHTQPPVIRQHAIGLALLGRMLPLTVGTTSQGRPTAPQAANEP